MTNAITPFQMSEKVRRTEYNGEVYFSVNDTVAYLAETNAPQDYIKKIRLRDQELDSVWGQFVPQLKLQSSDGKFYKTHCANLEGMLRIIQSIKSPKAEPFKQWLAKVGAERIAEEIDPSKAIARGRQAFFKRGKSAEWVEKREKLIDAQKTWSNTMTKDAGLDSDGVRITTAILHKGLTTYSPAEQKEIMGIDDTPRNHMNEIELSLHSLMLTVHETKVREENIRGTQAVKESTKPVISMIQDTKDKIEKTLGRSILTTPPKLRIKKE